MDDDVEYENPPLLVEYDRLSAVIQAAFDRDDDQMARFADSDYEFGDLP